MATVTNWIDHLSASEVKGAIYPGVGSEGILVILGLIIWIGWHVITAKQEKEELEKMLVREERRQKNHPRTIDIDIIIFKDSFIDTPNLQIPHPGALIRKFVLVPLAELASDEIFPKTNIKIVDLLEKCPDTSVVQKYIIDKKA